MVRTRGFSLLEILFSMVMFIIVISAFAMVFPSGYHLNLKSYRENQGVELANAILQEVATKPFESPPGGSSTGGSLQNLAQWTGECTRSGSGPECGCSTAGQWTPQALCNFYQNNPDLASEYQYALPSATGNESAGITVNFLVPPGTGTNDNGLAQITVHLIWNETDSGGVIRHDVTLSTFATYDRD